MLTRIDCCPSCQGPLEIRELYCPACDVQLRGRFEQPGGPFARLSDEQAAFLRLFVLSRGNLSDIERTLGVSYPTVRAKLDDLIAAIGEERPAAPAPAVAPASPLSRSEVLARVAAGQLSPDEGMALLKQLAETE